MEKKKRGGIVEIAMLGTVALALLKLLELADITWMIVFLPLLISAVLLMIMLLILYLQNRRDQ